MAANAILSLDEKATASYWNATTSPIPTTAAECVTQGWASPTYLWKFDNRSVVSYPDRITATNLSIANSSYCTTETLVHPYTGDVGLECWAHPSWAAYLYGPNTSFMDIGAVSFTFSILFRIPNIDSGWSYRALIGKTNFAGSVAGAGIGWYFYLRSDNNLYFFVKDAGGYDYSAPVAIPCDDALHLLTYHRDIVTPKHRFFLDGNATVEVTCAHAGSLSNGNTFCLNGTYGLSRKMYAWLLCNVGVADGRTGHDNLWAALHPWRSEYATKTRAGTLCSYVPSSRVFVNGSGRPAHAYDANSGVSGLLAPKPVTFLGLYSIRLIEDTYSEGAPWYMYYWAATNCTRAVIESPSGFLRAAQITLSAANGYVSSYAAPLTGATNVPFRFGCVAKQAGVGSELRLTAVFSGDPGGSETFTDFVTTNALASDWTRYSGACTPTRSAHTSVVLRAGAATNGNKVAFDHFWGMQNATVDPPAWILTWTASATAATQSITVTNDGTKLLASKGMIKAKLQNLNTRSGKHVLLWAESTNASPYIEVGFDGADAYITIRDSSRSLVATVTAANAITTSEHEILWHWDAAETVTGANHISIDVDGVQAATGRTTAWTPPADSALTPIGIGCGNSANELDAAFSELIVYNAANFVIDFGPLSAAEITDASVSMERGALLVIAALPLTDAASAMTRGRAFSPEPAAEQTDTNLEVTRGTDTELSAAELTDTSLAAARGRMLELAADEITDAEIDPRIYNQPIHADCTGARIGSSNTASALRSSATRTSVGPRRE